MLKINKNDIEDRIVNADLIRVDKHENDFYPVVEADGRIGLYGAGEILYPDLSANEYDAC